MGLRQGNRLRCRETSESSVPDTVGGTPVLRLFDQLRRPVGFAIGFVCALQLVAATPVSGSTRVGELAGVEGVRDNQLLGYGLVVGLNGTGDKRQTVFSAQSLANFLERMGISVPATAFQVRNTAAVLVTATLPPFAQPGTKIDITAAAIGDAANLQGGLLVMTPLKAADGRVFAVAQGPVVTGGFVAGRGGNSQSVNHPTVGRIPGGALVEQSPPSTGMDGNKIRLQLKRSDFTAASAIAAAVNKRFGEGTAQAHNPALVELNVPRDFASRNVQFISEVESIPIDLNRATRIVINERTGTIVMGKDVRISPVSIMHGALTVEIVTTVGVSQPNPLASGETAVVQQSKVKAGEEKAKRVSLEPNATVEDLARGLQTIGATPRDIIAILQNLKTAGAIEAEIEVI